MLCHECLQSRMPAQLRLPAKPRMPPQTRMPAQTANADAPVEERPFNGREKAFRMSWGFSPSGRFSSGSSLKGHLRAVAFFRK
jgi:hypothetical protein